ncbi:hypothetical protein AKJ48_00165 [candidate division MSBL1 archaeon SCGC-AAA261O19]|uniref:2-amino-5-formylamino-6-ribosylaminopyrimidin-4(3H)-one 5'-monophosphate deformylase n=1 Tax=candidate division MSBL1 archaeon SCGC-AAA261O19 TaxID=1698277 RepID=A0A133VFB2_9EURY|nr:hypothetical protein AKJ48_00165 [candidate division MSBL1 archaeon SCGC-AAA261O19]
MKVGILALGSHHERHGAALPLDTDAQIAEHIAREAAKRASAEFFGVLKSSYELPEINTGEHQSLEELEGEVREAVQEAKDEGFDAIVLVNAHGGNEKLSERLNAIEENLGMKIIFNTIICKLEGPHAGTGELSIGSVIGITDESKLEEHTNVGKHPEVGFAGLQEVREKYLWAEKHAREIEEFGVKIDKFLGEKILQCAIVDVINDVRELGTA